MPIEFWWWIEPLLETGLLTLFLCGGVGMILEQQSSDHYHVLWLFADCNIRT